MHKDPCSCCLHKDRCSCIRIIRYARGSADLKQLKGDSETLLGRTKTKPPRPVCAVGPNKSAEDALQPAELPRVCCVLARSFGEAAGVRCVKALSR